MSSIRRSWVTCSARIGRRFWFRANVEVPTAWKGGRVDLLWDTQSEATLWIDGKSVQGLNMTSGDRPDAILLDCSRGGETLSFQIEMACNSKFGKAPFVGPPPPEPVISSFHLRRCEIARFNPRTWEIYFDALTLIGLYDELARDGDISQKSWAGFLLAELNHFCNIFDLDDETTWSGRERFCAAYTAIATARASLKSAPSAMLMSTPPGYGRWQRHTASASAPSAL